MKKLMMMAVVAAMSFGAQADLLYFLVDGFSYEGPKYNFDYAVVGVAKNGVQDWDEGKNVYLYIQPSAGSSAGASKTLAADNSGTYSVAGPAWADLSDYTANDYTFYIETYKYGFGQSPIWGYNSETAQSYQQLLAGNHIYINDTSTPNVTAWNVPEPTSGMLFLLGFAALSLRRKRV